MLWNSRWFPGTNLQDINLDWILKKVSALRGGSTGQYLYKKSNKDFDFGWKTGSGGGGTSDYLDLDNKPSINNIELVGNKTASDLGLAASTDIPEVPVQSVNGKTGAVILSASDVGAYVKPVTGIPKTDLSSAVQTSLNKADTALQAVPSTYRTAEAQNAIDTEQNAQIDAKAKANEVAILITGARPSMAVTAGQYVIVRNSTISGISDGLYTANVALSPSVDVTAANLSAVPSGGLNDVRPISLGGTGGATADMARTNIDVPYCSTFNLAQGVTLNLAILGAQLFLLLTIGTNNDTRDGVYMIGKGQNDTVSPHITTIHSATGLSITSSPAQLTLVNSSGISARIICITYPNGNLPTAVN